MPSVTASPLSFNLTWGETRLIPERFSAAALMLALMMGAPRIGPGTALQDPVAVPQLDRLTRQEKIVNPDGTPSIRLQTIWQLTMEAIEAAFGNQQGQITDLAAILRRLEAAEDKAEAARTQAAETAKENALETSYTDPISTLSASSNGNIAIMAHQRVYGDGTRVSVNAGGVSGYNSGDYVTVFYNDAARTGGAVTYQATTGTVAQKNGVHIVGQATIPQAGSPPTTGTSPTPPGYNGKWSSGEIEDV